MSLEERIANATGESKKILETCKKIQDLVLIVKEFEVAQERMRLAVIEFNEFVK